MTSGHQEGGKWVAMREEGGGLLNHCDIHLIKLKKIIKLKKELEIKFCFKL